MAKLKLLSIQYKWAYCILQIEMDKNPSLWIEKPHIEPAEDLTKNHASHVGLLNDVLSHKTPKTIHWDMSF